MSIINLVSKQTDLQTPDANGYWIAVLQTGLFGTFYKKEPDDYWRALLNSEGNFRYGYGSTKSLIEGIVHVNHFVINTAILVNRPRRS